MIGDITKQTKTKQPNKNPKTEFKCTVLAKFILILNFVSNYLYFKTVELFYLMIKEQII